MERAIRLTGSPRLLVAVLLIVVVAALYFARDLLIPVSLASLLCFVLAPVATALEHRVGRVASVMVVVACACCVLGGTSYMVVAQVNELAAQLPTYRENIQAKIESLRGGALEMATVALGELENELQDPRVTEPSAGGVEVATDATDASPLPSVQLVAPRASPLMGMLSAFAPMLKPLGTGGVVIVLMTFLLLERRSLRDRWISLMEHEALGVTTQALGDASRHLSRFLLMQAAINGVHGLCVGIAMLALGVPNYMLWGVLSFLLRFVPYLGPMLAAAMPILLSLAVFDDWSQPMLVLAFFVAIELISNNLLEPWLYGSSAGMSPLAVVLTATFWTWLWGAPGLVLATPVTIYVVVLSRYVPDLRFLAVMLSDEPPLSVGRRVYQRLSARDHEGALELAEKACAGERSQFVIHDRIVLPALAMAEIDAHRGSIDPRRAAFLRQSIEEIAGELREGAALLTDEPATTCPESASTDRATIVDDPSEAPIDRSDTVPVVFCAAAGEGGDALVAALLVHLLAASGVRCAVAPFLVAGAGLGDSAALGENDIVCISALPPLALANARKACRQLRAAHPGVRIVVGLWTEDGPLERAAARLGGAVGHTDLRVVTTFVGARAALAELKSSVGSAHIGV